ncbi:MAG: ribonuclease [Lachnospiraceae bacterium]|nr:ribonuclease [Lachnospiraceae bacterium]
MKRRYKHFAGIRIFLAIVLVALGLCGCSYSVKLSDGSDKVVVNAVDDGSLSEKGNLETKEHPKDAPDDKSLIPEDGYYYDLEEVVLYLDTYGKLPSNFITKKEAGELGWEGGPIEDFVPGAAIGGNHYGNYEKLLPEGKYKECDIGTRNAKGRGAKRLVYSDDGKYYYTDDHYGSFKEVVVKDGVVEVLE